MPVFSKITGNAAHKFYCTRICSGYSKSSSVSLRDVLTSPYPTVFQCQRTEMAIHTGMILVDTMNPPILSTDSTMLNKNRHTLILPDT